MAIQSDKINVRFSSRFILQSGNLEKGAKTTILNYEIFQQDWIPDTVLESGSFSMPIIKISAEMIAVDTFLQNKAIARLKEVRTHHAAISMIGGYSLFDAGLILDSWQFYQVAGEWHTSHPISGSFSGALDPTLVNRINALLALVLPPPAWAWADSPSAGNIEVKCMPVAGVDHYAVYNGEEYLNDVPNETPNIIAVPSGSYSIRMAAVAPSDRVGIMSVPTLITVI